MTPLLHLHFVLSSPYTTLCLCSSVSFDASRFLCSPIRFITCFILRPRSSSSVDLQILIISFYITLGSFSLLLLFVLPVFPYLLQGKGTGSCCRSALFHMSLSLPLCIPLDNRKPESNNPSQNLCFLPEYSIF